VRNVAELRGEDWEAWSITGPCCIPAAVHWEVWIFSTVDGRHHAECRRL